ncbi:MAG: TonB-dependent siderophore receptor [Acidobacteriota bacterium]|nr:TonB-dependent siderophore receptor [Acidobacteriota bacterium]
MFYLKSLMLSTVCLLVLGASSVPAHAAGAAEAEPAEPMEGCMAGAGPVRALSGVVTDQAGSHVPNARITVVCGTVHYAAATDASGNYTVGVPAGSYHLHAEAANVGRASLFIAVEDREQATVVNAVLKIGTVLTEVDVTVAGDYATVESSGGTKSELPLAEVPQAISVINRAVMDSQDVVKLDDALRNVAGVMAGGYYDGWDYYRIRGFDASFNTYIDGLRGGNGMSEEPWALESVEVLKGPSSALYGQSVLGGLVNIVTRKPVPYTFFRGQVTAGSFNFVDPAVDFGGSLNSTHTLYGRVTALYHSADTPVDYTFRHRYYISPTLTWAPTSATSLTLLSRFERDNGRQAMPLPAVGTVLPNPNGSIRMSLYNGELEDNANKLQQANQQFGYQLRHAFNSHFTLRQDARFAWYQQEWNRIYYPSYLGSDDRTLYRYPLNWHGPWQNHEVDTRLEGNGKLFGLEHAALLGFDFYRNPANARGYSIDFSNPAAYEPLDLYQPVYGANPVQTLTLYTASNTVTQYAGVYLQDHIRLPQHVTVTMGGRVDFAKNESAGSANQNSVSETPRVGITWQAVPSTSIYASFAKSFLPQSGMVYDGSTSGSYLPPEHGQQWEAGAKSNLWGGRVTGTVAIFQLNRGNVATSDATHPNFYVLTGEQRSRGIELESALHPLAGWNVIASYSYINAEVLHDTTLAAGTPTLNAPKHLFNLWSTYEVQKGFLRGASIGLGGRHYTDQAGDQANSFQLPGYGLLDASLSYRRGHALWQVNASNLANKRYFSGSYNNMYVKPGDPRILRGSMSWNF